MKIYKTIEFYDEYSMYDGRIKIKTNVPNDILQDTIWKLCEQHGWLEEEDMPLEEDYKCQYYLGNSPTEGG